jgi:hypothetical protein
MRDVYVIGAYTTVFKKHPGMSFADLAREAGILVAPPASRSAAQALVCTRRSGTLVAAKRFAGPVRSDG